MSPPVVAVVGWSDSGKTTLVAKLVEELQGRGLRVGVVKHAEHALKLGPAETDSARLLASGARSVVVAGSEATLRFDTAAGERSLRALAADMPVDLVIAEGFKSRSEPGVPKIEVRASPDAQPCVDPHERLALVSDTDPRADFARADVAALSDLILRQCMTSDLDRLLADAYSAHGHRCPGMVLGVRMAMLGCDLVGIQQPKQTGGLLIWVEIDRCAADALQSVTGCRPGKRTLKLVDNGKLAATFLNQTNGIAYRVAARPDSRAAAADFGEMPGGDRYAAQAAAYRVLPDARLFTVQRVHVDVPRADLPGRPTSRVVCRVCHEEVCDGREVWRDGQPLCRPCSGATVYYAEVA